MSVQARRLLHAPHPASLPGCVAACSSPGGSPRFLVALYGVPRHASAGSIPAVLAAASTAAAAATTTAAFATLPSCRAR